MPLASALLDFLLAVATARGLSVGVAGFGTVRFVGFRVAMRSVRSLLGICKRWGIGCVGMGLVGGGVRRFL